MKPDIQFLQKQINDLQTILDGLSNSSTINRNIETAFTERLNGTFIAPTGTSTAPTQSISVPSVPTTITVPAQPSGTLTVVYKGITYNLLYK